MTEQSKHYLIVDSLKRIVDFLGSGGTAEDSYVVKQLNFIEKIKQLGGEHGREDIQDNI